MAQAIDPGEKRKIDKLVGRERSANSFEFIAGEWIKTHLANRAESHTSKVIGRLKRDAYPWIGTRPIADIKPREILAFLQTVEIRSPDTAHRLKQNISQVFRYAIATQRAERDPTADLRGALAPVVGGHFAAITDPEEVGKLMRAIEGYTGFLVVRCALRLLPLVFVRPGELRRAKWSEIDLKAAECNIPGERMKMKQAHLVPLSTQAVAILTELKPLTEKSEYVFPSARGRSRPMSEGAIPVALKALGYDGNSMTGHGFRAMARTMLDEILGFRPEIIEHQLAHSVRDPLGRAYNRTSYLDERRQMMQKWADYLETLEDRTSR